MASTSDAALPTVEATSAGESTADEGGNSMMKRSESRNVLDLTGAAIASADTLNPEHFTDSWGTLASTGSVVPSISLPRQSTDVRHFAVGRTLLQSIREPSLIPSFLPSTFDVTQFSLKSLLCFVLSLAWLKDLLSLSQIVFNSQIWEVRS